MAEIATMISAIAVLMVAIGAFVFMIAISAVFVRFGNAIEAIADSYLRKSEDGTPSNT